MSAHDHAAAFGEGDRVPPALLLNDGGQQGDLMRAVPVWVRWIGLQRVGINQPRVGAVNGNAHAPAGVSTPRKESLIAEPINEKYLLILWWTRIKMIKTP